jgi:RNA polymerase sigma-70 factor (ECF subfamily)
LSTLSRLNLQREEQDQKIIRRCLQGETEAFADIIETYKLRLYEMVYRWVGQKELSEEILQDVFLKAFRQLKNFRGESKFSTWIFQITLNRCRDFYRSKRGKKEPLSIEEISLQDTSPPSDQRAMTRQETHRLREALQMLPPIYREAISLRYLSEMSNEEIAQTLGESLSNVKMRVSRGLMKLRKKLEGIQKSL